MLNPQTRRVDDNPTFLRRVADDLVNSSRPVAERNNSELVNEIPDKLVANSNEQMVADVIKGVLGAVVNNAKDTCIRISARVLYGNRVEVFVRDSNSYHTYAIACGLQDAAQKATKMGGNINITSQREKITTVSFVFPA